MAVKSTGLPKSVTPLEADGVPGAEFSGTGFSAKLTASVPNGGVFVLTTIGSEEPPKTQLTELEPNLT